MRQFTFVGPKLLTTLTTTFHMGGETVSFVEGVCDLADLSPVQMAWLDKQIEKKLIIETTPEQKTKPSKRAAKKKRG